MAASGLRMPYSSIGQADKAGCPATDIANLLSASPSPAGSSSAIAESMPSSDRIEEATSAASWRIPCKGSACEPFGDDVLGGTSRCLGRLPCCAADGVTYNHLLLGSGV